MKYISPHNLTFTQMEIFLCSVECGNFTAAAQKLNYSQSMISKTIATLENELGLILFLREKTSNINVLTPAGKQLYKDWKNIFNETELSIEKAHMIQTGVSNSLTVGSLDTMINCVQLEEIIKRFCYINPNNILSYNEFTMSEILELARQHKLDIIMTAKHDTPTLELYGYVWKTMIKTYISIFVHKSNPLYERDELSISDLYKEDFIVPFPTSNPNYIKLLTSLCEENGFAPKIATYVSNAHSFEMNLLGSKGVVLADNYTNIRHKEIKMFVLKNIRADVVIAWSNQIINPNIDKFISIVDEFLYEQQE